MALDPDRPQLAAEGIKPVALWVIPVSDLGGVARHVLDAVRTGIPGFEMVVLCPPGRLAEALNSSGVRTAVGRFGPASGVRRSVRTLRSAVARLRPSVVHSHLAYADVIVAAAPLPSGVVRVSTEHGIADDDAVYHGSRLKGACMAQVHHARLSRFDALIAVSEATRAAMVKKWRPSGEVVVIYNGVDRAFTPPRVSSAGQLRILALARLSPEKRIPQLLDAFALVHAERPDARLVVAGVGELEQELKVRASELGVSGAVSFPGFVDAEAAMHGADVLAQLSIWENCSYSLLDAANLGMRVVASRVGGNPEIVSEPGLVDAEDAVQVAAALLDPAGVSTLDNWPSVAEMTAAIAKVYVTAGARTSAGLPDRVTIATNNGDIGGGEVMLLSIADTLRELGIGVTVVGPSSPGQLIAAARNAGHETVELPAEGRLAWMRALRRWHDAEAQRSALWCNGLVPSVATAGHASRIVHFHQRPTGLQRLLAPLARIGALATLVPSRSMSSALSGAEVFPNWSPQVTALQFGGTDNKVIRLGFLGRPSIDKGVHILAKALEILERTDPGAFRLVLGGEPRFVSSEARVAVERALEPVSARVDRLGWVSPDEFFSQIDLLVVPSVWPEPFGLVVTEAMSAGVPVLVSDAGALPEIVTPETGLVFPAGDATALASLVSSTPREALASRALAARKRWALKYSPEAGVRRTARLLAGLRLSGSKASQQKISS